MSAQHPHMSPEGEHSEHMAHRRATAPWLFNGHASYRRWVHFFGIRRHVDGVGALESTDHFALPWELEDTNLRPELLETINAHYVIHGLREWHPVWRRHWCSTGPRFLEMSVLTYWVMLDHPSIQRLSQWMLEEKRRIRVEHPYCDAARIVTTKLLAQGLRRYLINPQPYMSGPNFPHSSGD